MEVLNIGDFKEDIVTICYIKCPHCGEEISKELLELESMDTIFCKHCGKQYKVE